jgi:hypothetical protein
LGFSRKVIVAVPVTLMALAFICMITSGILSYYYVHSKPERPRPDINLTCPLEIHGWTVYLTPTEKSLLNWLLFVSVGSGASALVWILCFWNRLSALVGVGFPRLWGR